MVYSLRCAQVRGFTDGQETTYVHTGVQVPGGHRASDWAEAVAEDLSPAQAFGQHPGAVVSTVSGVRVRGRHWEPS